MTYEIRFIRHRLQFIVMTDKNCWQIH